MAFRIFSKAFSEGSIFVREYEWKFKHSYDCDYEDTIYARPEYYEKVKVKLYDWRMGFGIDDRYPKRVIEQ